MNYPIINYKSYIYRITFFKYKRQFKITAIHKINLKKY